MISLRGRRRTSCWVTNESSPVSARIALARFFKRAGAKVSGIVRLNAQLRVSLAAPRIDATHMTPAEIMLTQ